MINAIQIIAERRIAEALRNGELENRDWHGRPLPNEDDRLVPPELRMAFKILKNAGYLPPEIEMRKEIHNLEELIANTEDEHMRLKQMKKLNLLVTQLDAKRGRPANLEAQQDYHRRVVERISCRSIKGGKPDR